jgi:hypothetical protein
MKFGANKDVYGMMKRELNKNAIEMCLNRSLIPGATGRIDGPFFPQDKAKL